MFVGRAGRGKVEHSKAKKVCKGLPRPLGNFASKNPLKTEVGLGAPYWKTLKCNFVPPCRERCVVAVAVWMAPIYKQGGGAVWVTRWSQQ